MPGIWKIENYGFCLVYKKPIFVARNISLCNCLYYWDGYSSLKQMASYRSIRFWAWSMVPVYCVCSFAIATAICGVMVVVVMVVGCDTCDSWGWNANIIVLSEKPAKCDTMHAVPPVLQLLALSTAMSCMLVWCAKQVVYITACLSFFVFWTERLKEQQGQQSEYMTLCIVHCIACMVHIFTVALTFNQRGVLNKLCALLHVCHSLSVFSAGEMEEVQGEYMTVHCAVHQWFSIYI